MKGTFVEREKKKEKRPKNPPEGGAKKSAAAALTLVPGVGATVTAPVCLPRVAPSGSFLFFSNFSNLQNLSAPNILVLRILIHLPPLLERASLFYLRHRR